MSSNTGWSWSLRFVMALAIAATMWVGAATLALGARAQRANAAIPAPSASHR